MCMCVSLGQLSRTNSQKPMQHSYDTTVTSLWLCIRQLSHHLSQAWRSLGSSLASGSVSSCSLFLASLAHTQQLGGDEEQQLVGVGPVRRSSTMEVAGGFSRLLALWHKGGGSVSLSVG